MKEILKIIKISIIICAGLVLINSLFGAHRWENIMDWSVWGTYFFYSFVLTALNSTYFNLFARKIGWQGAKLMRIILAAVGSIVLTMIGFFLCRLIDETLFQGFTVQHFLTNEKLSYYLFPLSLTAFISLIFHLVYFYKALQDKRVTEQKIIAGNASAKFESLKNQIDPHFLFNSLNVLTSLIEENPEQAQKFTTGLSKIYRYVLEQKNKELVDLEEEIKFAVTYINLLKMRFENSIYFEVPGQLSSPEAKVVPLSLQLLLENTIKHNVVSENKPLRIKIFEENGYLVLENNLQEKDVLQKRAGVGLQNIVSRYGLVTRREVQIIKDSQKFSVKIPILTKQINIMKTENISENNAYFKAKRRVKEIKEFYGNLISYCLVIPGLVLVNYYTYWDFKWFWFPMAGWGLGLVIHGFSVFGYGANWEERKIQELMEKEKQCTKTWN